MSDRFFYKVDGSRRKVSQKEYDQLQRRQASAIRAAGKQVWQDRRGRQYSVSQEEFDRRQEKRETARRASRIGWGAIRSEKDALEAQFDQRVITYPGPEADGITSWPQVRQFRADLYDWAAAAVAVDKRKGTHCVSVSVASTINRPGGLSQLPGTVINPALLIVKDGKIIKYDRSQIDDQMRLLFDNLKGMGKYPDKQRRQEVRPGQVISGTVTRESAPEPRAARGWSADLESTIMITPAGRDGEC